MKIRKAPDGSGDRVGHFAALHESGYGTKRTCGQRRVMSALGGGKADIRVGGDRRLGTLCRWRVSTPANEALARESETMRLAGLRLKSENPAAQASALAQLLDSVVDESSVHVGDAFVRFVEGGPPGRPQLDGELFA